MVAHHEPCCSAIFSLQIVNILLDVQFLYSSHGYSSHLTPVHQFIIIIIITNTTFTMQSLLLSSSPDSKLFPQILPIVVSLTFSD